HQFTDLIDAVKTVRGHIEKIEKIEKIDLSEAENLFINSIDYSLNSPDNNIYPIKFPTAIGKTSYLLDAMNEKIKSSTICFSTHYLKDEVSKDMKFDHVV